MATREVRTYCAMCISRCGVVATVEDGVLARVRADPAHPNGCICVKGTAAPEMVYAPERLRYPMVRTRPKGERDPGWTRVPWEEALRLTASRLLAARAEFGAESVVMGYATPSGSTASDFDPWLLRLAHAFGTPNVLMPLHICNWGRNYGAQYTYGSGTPPPDYDRARCILLWGFNPRTSWPAAALRIARAQQRGAKLIVIDPRQSGMVDRADVWLRVRPGGDAALALSMIHVLLEEELQDAAFVRDWTNGPFLVRDDTGQLLTEADRLAEGRPDTYYAWDEAYGGVVEYSAAREYARPAVRALDGNYPCRLADGEVVSCRPALALLRELAARYAPERAEALTWVPAAEVRRAVRLFAGEKPSCYFSWAGLEQHSDAAQTNRAICLFYALTGQIDSPGSNLHFGRTPTNAIAGEELLAREQAARRLGYAERPLGPAGNPGRVQAVDVYRAVRTGEPYPVKALVLFGSDPLLANGDPLEGRRALAALDFYAHVDTVCNPSAAFADVLLPTCTGWEREGLMASFPVGEDAAAWAQLRPAVVPPRHESRPDLAIIFDLAVRLGLGGHFFDGDVEAALDYQLAPAGLTARQLRERPGGMHLDVVTVARTYAASDPRTGQPRGFATPTRKVEIYSTSFARAGQAPLPEPRLPPQSVLDAADSDYPLTLTFFRLLQFIDEQDRHVPTLRRQVREPFVEIHPATAAALGVREGEWVRLETASGAIRLTARLRASLDPRVVATQYGWWQGCAPLGLPERDALSAEGTNANLLVANRGIDPIGASVPHRSLPCRVRKARPLP